MLKFYVECLFFRNIFCINCYNLNFLKNRVKGKVYELMYYLGRRYNLGNYEWGGKKFKEVRS